LWRNQHGAAHVRAPHVVLVPVRDRLDAAATRAEGSNRMTRLSRCLLVLLGLLCARGASATPPSYAGGQVRYWVFNDPNDLRDVLAYWVPGPFHVQLEYWDFLDPHTDDQFRPEVALHLRDARKSVYTLGYRHEGHQERFWLGTDQVLTDHVVGRVEVSPI